MTKWEQQQFDEFKHMVENSPTLNISKKRMFERMLDEMLRLWNSKDII